MIQTGQKTDSRKTLPEQKRFPEQKQRATESERPEPEQTLQAILSGVSPERLSPEAVLALSHRMGNSALSELAARREGPADLMPCPVPGSMPEMKAAVLGEGSPDLIAPVDFAGLPPLEAGSGMAFGGV